MAKTRTTLTIEFDGGIKEVNQIMKLLNGKIHDIDLRITEGKKRSVASEPDNKKQIDKSRTRRHIPFNSREMNEGVSRLFDKFAEEMGAVVIDLGDIEDNDESEES